MCKSVYAEDVEAGDELDFSMDDFCYNDLADQSYALLERKTDWWSGENGEPWVTLHTDQGTFDMPADHKVMRKVQE